MASSYEGMPFAVLEALASGSTVLLSDIPAHRELALPEEHYFRVCDVAQLRVGLLRLRSESGPWRLRPPSTLIDGRFEWGAIAQKTAAVFHRVLGSLEKTAATTTPGI